MPASPIFVFEDAAHREVTNRILRRLPPISGAAVRLRAAKGLRDGRGPVHAGTFLRKRVILLNCNRSEFPRILVHELFHFVWVRLGNPRRRGFEELLASERKGGARGELGWSAEWRKRALTGSDVRLRRRRWREYCCESFCDTAAWLYSGMRRHDEFTLGSHFRQERRDWFRKGIETERLSI